MSIKQNKTFIIQPYLGVDSYLTGSTLVGDSLYYNMSLNPSAFTTSLSALTVNQEGYFESGTRLGADLVTTIGDYDDSNNGTKLLIEDDSGTISLIGNNINLFTTSNPPFPSDLYHNKTVIPQASGTVSYDTRVITKDTSVSGYNNTFYGDVRSITDASNDNGTGTVGLASFTRSTGTHDLSYLYGAEFESRLSGTGDVGFLNGAVVDVLVDGTNTSSVSTISRTLSTNTTINNPNTTISSIQGYHPTVNLQKGNIGGAAIIFMDFDISSSPDLDITGDLFYIGAGDDNMSSVNNGGFKRFISYTGGLESYFGGSITANSFIKSGSTSDDVLLGDGTTTSLSNITKTKTKTGVTGYTFNETNKDVAPLFTASTAVDAVVELDTPIGTRFILSQWGDGEVTISGEVGVTLRYPSDELPIPASQYSWIELEVIDTNEVAVIGRLKLA